MPRLEGKIVIVTGGASGIGQATVRRLHAENATVIVADIDLSGATRLSAELGTRVIASKTDVCDGSDWAELVQFCLDRFGRIDVLVNNAGWGTPATAIVDETHSTHRAMLDLNITAVWSGIRAVLPNMMENRSGSIVNVSSIDGIAGVAHMATYAATKFAVTGLTRSVALEVGHAGIRVNSVHPGIIETPLVNSMPPGMRIRLDDCISRQPIERMGRPHEVANAILFFASDESSYCTGSSLLVDGGHLAGPHRMAMD